MQANRLKQRKADFGITADAVCLPGLTGGHVKVSTDTPEFRTIARLDSTDVAETWPPATLRKLAGFGGSNWAKVFRGGKDFSHLRRLVAAGEVPSLPGSMVDLITARLSAEILCGCGAALMLRKHSVTCESFGCTVFGRKECLRLLARAFPDQRLQLRVDP